MKNCVLSKANFQQLVCILSKDEALTARLQQSAKEESHRVLVSLDKYLYEKIGDVLTEELALNGFDENYNLNSVGEKLEFFIDLFNEDANARHPH